MAHNPKLSQALMTWCIESAIGLIYAATEKAGQKLSGKMIGTVLRQGAFDASVSPRQISCMTYELRRSNYIQVGEGDSVRLTNKAKIKIIDKIIDDSAWDGKYRVVSFDIPEVKRNNRDNFRRAIKRMGFVQAQKSLWASKRNVGDLVDAAAEEFGVTEYFAYFIADRSNIDSHLRKLLQ